MLNQSKQIEDRLNTNCDYSSLVAVLTKYAPLVKSRAVFFSGCGSETDDLIQEGSIGLLAAHRKYNRELSSFSTFARRCIDASIIDYIRKAHKLSNIPSELLVDITGVEVADSSSDPENYVSAKDEYTEIIARAEDLLSDYEYTVFSDMIRGYSVKEIAAKHNADIKSVSNSVTRIRLKLKK